MKVIEVTISLSLKVEPGSLEDPVIVKGEDGGKLRGDVCEALRPKGGSCPIQNIHVFHVLDARSPNRLLSIEARRHCLAPYAKGKAKKQTN